jgi:cbb3-type cytochrome oxidase maturation protein
METIFVLLPLALLIAAIAVGLFVWAARTGQFDDLDTPAVRILFDDAEIRQGGFFDEPTKQDRSHPRAAGGGGGNGHPRVRIQ